MLLRTIYEGVTGPAEYWVDYPFKRRPAFTEQDVKQYLRERQAVVTGASIDCYDKPFDRRGTFCKVIVGYISDNPGLINQLAGYLKPDYQPINIQVIPVTSRDPAAVNCDQSILYHDPNVSRYFDFPQTQEQPAPQGLAAVQLGTLMKGDIERVYHQKFGWGNIRYNADGTLLTIRFENPEFGFKHIKMSYVDKVLSYDPANPGDLAEVRRYFGIR